MSYPTLFRLISQLGGAGTSHLTTAKRGSAWNDYMDAKEVFRI